MWKINYWYNFTNDKIYEYSYYMKNNTPTMIHKKIKNKWYKCIKTEDDMGILKNFGWYCHNNFIKYRICKYNPIKLKLRMILGN